MQSVVVDLVVGQIGRSVGRGNSWDEPKVKKIIRYILIFFIITEGGKIWSSQSWIVRSDFYLNLWIANGLQIAKNNKQKRSDRAMNGPNNQREEKVLQIQSNTCESNQCKYRWARIKEAIYWPSNKQDSILYLKSMRDWNKNYRRQGFWWTLPWKKAWTSHWTISELKLNQAILSNERRAFDGCSNRT